jgi:hypothetical protein
LAVCVYMVFTTRQQRSGLVVRLRLLLACDPR